MRRSEDELLPLQARPRAEARSEPLDAGQGLGERETDLPPAAPIVRGASGPDTQELRRIAEHQERLLADVRAGLERFRQRSASLAKDYVRVLGRALPPTFGRARR